MDIRKALKDILKENEAIKIKNLKERVRYRRTFPQENQ